MNHERNIYYFIQRHMATTTNKTAAKLQRESHLCDTTGKHLSNLDVGSRFDSHEAHFLVDAQTRKGRQQHLTGCVSLRTTKP